MSRIRKFGILTCIISILTCSYLLINYYILEPRKNSSNLDELKNIVELDNKEIDINALKSINQNFWGWLRIDNTNIDYPVLQTNNNEFYLTHDSDGNKSKHGSIFFDYQVILDDNTKSKNIVIYGHNIKNQTMFNSLDKYKDKDFYNTANIIKLYTEEGKKIYKIFAVLIVDINNADQYLGYWNTNFTDEQFEELLDNINKKKLYDTGVNVDKSSHVLTLSTCNYTYQNARIIVVAVQESPFYEHSSF